MSGIKNGDALSAAAFSCRVTPYSMICTTGSPAPWWPYRPSLLARLSARLLDRLGHEQVDVLGFSWGGALAQQFAYQHAKRCRRLVLAATSPGHLMVPGKLTALLKMATPLVERLWLLPPGDRRIGME
jgi:pimeloyl-ACP methyl ester carboxylesterase